MTWHAMWLASASATARYTGAPGWKPSLAMVSRPKRTRSSVERRHVAAALAALARPVAQRAVVPTGVGAGHPAQRLRQRRETGGSAAAGRTPRAARRRRLRSRLAMCSRASTARIEPTWSTTSLTPVTTIGEVDRPAARRRAAARASAPSSARCARATPIRCAAAHGAASSGTNWPHNASLLRRHADAGGRRVAGDQQAQRAPRRAHACLRARRPPRAGAARARACAAPAPPAAGSTRA